jgi:hypothetical protein
MTSNLKGLPSDMRTEKVARPEFLYTLYLDWPISGVD